MKSINKVKCDKVEELYNNGLGVKAIANKVKIHRGTVSHILQRKGIWLKEKRRPFKNLYNIKFFNTYTKESCYWAGFILADGNVRSNVAKLQIALGKKDTNHLVKFSKAIKFSGKLYPDRECMRIIVSGKWLIDDLQDNYEIGPNKTFAAKISNKIPDKYISHFVRGYFDGDGSLTKSKFATMANINITGNIYTVSKIIEVIEDKLNIKKSAICKSKKSFQTSYYGKKARVILDWMYKGSRKNMRLDRKYDLYKKYKKEKTL